MSPALYPTNPRPGPAASTAPGGAGQTRQTAQAQSGSGQASRAAGDDIAIVAVLGYN